MLPAPSRFRGKFDANNRTRSNESPLKRVGRITVPSMRMLHWSFSKLPRWANVSLLLLLAAVVGASTLLFARWPYKRERIIAGLEGATRSRVQVQRFRSTFFPEPGCTLEKVTIDRHAPKPIAEAEKIHFRSSWLSVLAFRKYIRHIEAQRLRVHIPSDFPPPIQSRGSGGLGEVVIGEFAADGATIYATSDDDEPVRFAIHQLRLREVGVDKQMAYTAVLDLPDPPGQLKSSGRIGPFSSGERARTPVKGSFQLQDASLDKYKGLAGRIDGEGKFQGPFENIRVTGGAAASQFEVNRSGNPVDLRTTFVATVNGSTGDVVLEDIQADFRETRLSVSGSVAGAHGKVVSVDFLGERARIEDLLSMFTRSEKPALEGPVRLRAHADLPPGDKPFLHKLILQGSFAISNARWARPPTQIKVNSLSARARGDKDQVEERTADRVDPVLSQLKGAVLLKAGLATLSGVSFHVPGATASGGGTYNLLTKRLDLKGTVSMAADASEATSGFKSFLLRPFDRLFRRNYEKGATLPVSVSGHYPRPEYKIGLKK
jgi:AsmA-like C-terminal region